MTRGLTRIGVLLAATGALLSTGFGPPGLLERDGGRLPLPPSALRSLQDYRAPLLRARAAVVLDAASGAILYAKNAEERLAPASLTKMMTALVAVERGRLRQEVIASERVYVDPVVIGLDPGEALPLEDLLYGLLLMSGNDAGVAIAEGLAGSLPRFADWMNDKAVALGMHQTRFLNPHGLDAPGHYSTAADLARLTVAMMRDPTLARISGAREHTIPGPPLYKFRNSNPLLGAYSGVNGGKTGFTDLAGRCLAVSAERGGRQVVAIVLGSDNIALDGQVLLDYAYANHEWLPVETVASRRLPPSAQSAAGSGVVVALPRWEDSRFRWEASVDGPVTEREAPGARLVVESPLRRLGQFNIGARAAAQ
jgi:serine-type D-Ala-D-Ala carboxypeptidase (penicillin-binding protein 5/6)